MKRTISIRANKHLIEKIEELLPLLEDNPRVSPRGKLSRSELIRVALMYGITELEKIAINQNH
jgi:metal-responsive CopG/Arc/MetJ family transcriptional regulator